MTKETWLDWMPQGSALPELLSHDELVTHLSNSGIELTSTTLEYWRMLGVLPRPIRRRHKGATRPVYPTWFIPAIEHIRNLQSRDNSLDEIRSRLKEDVQLRLMDTTLHPLRPEDV